MSGGGSYVILTYKVWAEKGQFVSECQELGVASCGDTIDEAFRNIQDAVTLYLNSIEEQGDRPRIFKERGIRMLKAPRAPKSALTDVSVNEYVTRHCVNIGNVCHA